MTNNYLFKRIYESAQNDKTYKIGQEYSIDVKALYDKFGDNLKYGATITFTKDSDSPEFQYYDLYSNGDLAVMDGETATLESIDGDKFIFVCDMGEDSTRFTLSKEETDLGTNSVYFFDLDTEHESDTNNGLPPKYKDIFKNAYEKSKEPVVYDADELKNKMHVVKGEPPIKDNPLPDELDRSPEDEEVINNVLGVDTTWQKAPNYIRQITQDIRNVYKESPFGAKFDGLEYSGKTGYQVTIYTEGPKCNDIAESLKENIMDMLDEKGYSEVNIEIDNDEFEENGGCYLTVYLNEF